jgi:hypothetical protein
VDEGDRGIITETMIHPIIAQAVFDEAGDTGRHERSSHHLVVAGIVCSDLDMLRRVVTRTRKGLSKRLQDVLELKAFHTPAAVTRRLLRRLTQEDIEIYAVVIDKYASIQPRDAEAWYRQAYIVCIGEVLKRHPSVAFRLDRRYTNRNLQSQFLEYVLVNAPQENTALGIAFSDSISEPAIQAADFVAWSFYQKYELGNGGFCELLKERIVAEVALP